MMNGKLNYREYYLVPDDSHKSFYKKAVVRVYDDGTEILFSYGTPVIGRDSLGGLHRIWMGWSATTGRHIRAFCGLNKAGFENLAPVYA